MNKIIYQLKTLGLNEYFLLSLILLFGLLIRLYKIGNPIADWHSWRQADTASVTRTYLQKGINLLYPKYHDISSIQTGIFNSKGYRFVEFPIYNGIHAILVKTFPFFSLEIWGRLLSIFSALVSTVFVYLIGKRFIGKAGGLLSAFFFAFLPFNIYFTRVILPEPMGVAFGLISIWLFIKFVDNEKQWALYLSGIFMALAMLIKPFFFFYLVPLLYLAIRKYGISRIIGNAKVLITFLIFFNLSLAPFFLWRIWINQFPAGIPFFEWAFNGDRIRFRPSFWRWIFGERLGHLILGSWGLVPFTFGLISKKKDYFIHFFLLGMFFYVTVFATASVRHDYYQIITIPAISLAVAGGTLYLWNEKKLNQILTRLFLVFAVFIGLVTSGVQIKEFYKVNHPEIIEAGMAVDKITPKDALVIAPYNGDTAFLYQTKRWGWPAVDDSFDNLIKKGASYYVSVNLGDKDTIYISSHYRVLEKTDKYLIADLTQRAK